MGIADLKKWLDTATNGVAAGYHGVNPFDNGQGWTTQQAPARTPFVPPQQAPQRSFMQRVGAQVNPFDNGQTFNNALPVNNNSVPYQATHNGFTNTIGNILVKPAAATAGLVTEPFRAANAEVTNNQAALQASRQRQAQNWQNSIPGWMASQGVNGAQSVYNLGFKAPIQDLQGQHQAAGNTRNVGLQEFNRTAPGQLTHPIQYGIANAAHATPQQQQQAGLNPDATGAQKWFADPVMGAVASFGLAKGAGHVMDRGAPVVVRATQQVADANARMGQGGFISGSRNLTSSLDAQKYATFDSFYNDYKQFFDSQGIKPDQARTIYDDAQHAPVAISKSGTARTAAELQSQIETAHNAGDTALEAKLNAQLQDPAMSSTPAAMTPERRAELMAKMRGGTFTTAEPRNPFALDQRGAIPIRDEPLPEAKINGDAYESTLANQLRTQGGEVIETGKANGRQDGGVDLIHKVDGETRLIQAKYRSRDTTIHISTLAQIDGAAERYRQAHPQEKVVPTVYATKPLDADALQYATANGIKVVQTGLKGEATKQQSVRIGKSGSYKLTSTDHVAIQNSIPMADRADFLRQTKDPKSALSKKIAGATPDTVRQIVRHYYQGLNPEGSFELNQMKAVTAKLAKAHTPQEVADIIGHGSDGSELIKTLRKNSSDEKFMSDLVATRTKSGVRELVNKKLAKPIYQPIAGEGIKVTEKPKAAVKISGGGNFKQEVKPRGFSDTVFSSENTKVGLRKEMVKQDNSYTVKHNPQLITQARAMIKKDFDNARTTAMNDASDKGVALAGELIKLHQSRGEYGLAAELADKAAKNLTEAGRGVQAASLYSRISPEGIVRYAAKIAQDGGKKLDASTTEQLTQMAKQVQKMRDGEPKALAVHRMLELARSQNPSPLSKQLIDVWKAGLLTAPTTHLGNLASNAVEAATRDALVNPLATGIDMAASLVTGKRSRSLTARGGTGGFAEGAKRAGVYVKTGYDARNPLSKYELDNKTVFGKGPLGTAARAYTESVFRILGAADQPFYYHTLRNSLADRAGAAAKNEGLHGEAKAQFIDKFVKEPPTDALEGAVEDAKRSVFGNKTMLGTAASMIKRPATIKVGGKKVTSSGAAGNFVVPFSQVPASIATRILERSPAGYIQAAGDIVRGVKTGEFDQRSFTEHMANATVGTATAFVVGKALSDSNMISLGYPAQDPKEVARWKAEGKTPYSIKMGNKWVSLNYVQPFGSILAYGAAYSQARKEGQTVEQATATAAAQAGKSVTSQSFLQGVSGTLQAIQDPSRKAEQFLNSTAGSVIPNFVRAFAAAQDNKQRQVNSVPEALQNGVPFYRRDLLPVVDTYGRELQRPGGPGAGGAANRYLNPLRISNDTSTGVTHEVDRLHNTDPNNTKMDVQPTPVSNRLSFGGDAITLSPAQQTDLQRSVGQATNQAWSQLIQTPAYQAASDQEKVKMLNDTQNAVVDFAKRQYGQSNNVDMSKAKPIGSQQMAIISSVGGGNGGLQGYLQNATDQERQTKAVQDFTKSGSKAMQYGDNYYFKDGLGKVQSMPKVEYDFNVANAQLSLNMDSAKANQDLNGWMDLAGKQYDALEAKKRLYDPGTQPDKIAAIVLQQQNLMQEAAKYQAYGGFTKGSGNTKGASLPNIDTSIPSSLQGPVVSRSAYTAPNLTLKKKGSVRVAGRRSVRINAPKKLTARSA
jgi:hypothetical protein